MYVRFASLRHSTEYAYAYDTGADMFRKTPEIDSRFIQFQTYGDGLTAHSPSWPITREFFTDYLGSLAVAMLADPELVKELQWTLRRGADLVDIEFAATVKYKPSDGEYNKRRYYSAKERKISSSASKEHDKRYKQIESWNDGSPMSIYGILIGEYVSGLERYATAEDIYAWAQKQSDVYMTYPALALKWFKEGSEGAYSLDQARELQRAFGICRAICESHRLRAYAESDIENIRRKIERDQNPPAETQEVA